LWFSFGVQGVGWWVSGRFFQIRQSRMILDDYKCWPNYLSIKIIFCAFVN
jgi:hypothetical protein